MSGFIKSIKLTLFGSQATRFFKNHNKNQQSLSLYDNFVRMCSLPFYKAPSDATAELINIIKSCQLTNNHSDFLTYKQRKQARMKDIAKLELTKLAIQNWYIKRGEASTRFAQMKSYELGIMTTQKDLIHSDSEDYTQEMDKEVSIKAWNYPLHDITKLKACLPDSLKDTFGALHRSKITQLDNNKKLPYRAAMGH
jgi:hypothetical protein